MTHLQALQLKQLADAKGQPTIAYQTLLMPAELPYAAEGSGW